MEKITKRAMYEAMINFATENEFTAVIAGKDGDIHVGSAELIAFAENEIGLLAKKAEKAKERAASKKAEADELMTAVEAALTNEFAPIAEITARIEGEDVTAAKVQYRLNKLVEAGVAVKDDIKVAGAEGKARKIKGYKLADAE